MNNIPDKLPMKEQIDEASPSGDDLYLSDAELVELVNRRAGHKVAELRDGYIYCTDADPGEDGQYLPY